MIKRLFDVLSALFMLVLLSPLILLVALVVQFTMGSPVLFRQQRPGLHGKPFWLNKFRTMTNNGNDPVDPLSDKLRLTAVGRWLRRFSLDELPQLINVLKGDMSLVGPRPLLMEYLALYTPEQARRHDVRPGITGWAQINGRNATTWDERFKYDIWYVDNRSIFLDLKILAMTVWYVIQGKGVNQSGHATMTRFTGNNRDHG